MIKKKTCAYLVLLSLISNISFAQPTTAPKASKETQITINHSKPARSEVILFAKKAALTLYTLDQKNVMTQIKNQATLFTQSAWVNYEKELEKSGNIQEIQENNVRVRAIINGTISSQTLSDHRWQLTIPLHAGFFSKKHVKSQTLAIKATVENTQGRYLISNLDIHLTKPMAVIPNQLLRPKNCPLLPKASLPNGYQV